MCQNRVPEEYVFLNLPNCFHLFPLTIKVSRVVTKKKKRLLFFPAARPLQKSAYPQIEFNAPLRVCICKYLSCET